MQTEVNGKLLVVGITVTIWFIMNTLRM